MKMMKSMLFFYLFFSEHLGLHVLIYFVLVLMSLEVALERQTRGQKAKNHQDLGNIEYVLLAYHPRFDLGFFSHNIVFNCVV